MPSKRSCRRVWVAVALSLGLLLAACGGPTGGSAPVGPPQAPDFSLKDLNGQRVKLSEFRGKPVLLNFWASWCGPCRSEIPEIQALHEAHSDGDVVILAVDFGEPAGTARSFILENNLTFRVLTDEDSSVGRQFGVRGIPTSFFLDGQGKIVATHLGPMTRGEAEKSLAAAARS